MTSSERTASKNQKKFEDGSVRELEKTHKWITNRFYRLSDDSEKEVADSIRGIDEPTSIDDGPPSS